MHLLQPLDVGVFKSLKAHYYKACKKYLAENPGRVVTSEVIASLLAVAWPQAHTPLNIMAGFKKSGVYPLNPGEITDRDVAPSKVQVVKDSDKSSSTLSPSSQTSDQDLELLFQRRYEEGYDIYDERYVAWLQQNHPESVPPCSTSTNDSPPSINAKSSNRPESVPPCSTSTNDSPPSINAKSSNGMPNSDLSDILVLPQATHHRKRREAVNSKAKCITNDDVLEELKVKE